MIRISTKGKYGTRLMFQLALNYGNGPILLREIAKREDISVRYLEHLVPLLKSAHLINSTRGAKGGYSLAKDPKDITLKDIIQILEGPLYPSECVQIPSVCSRSSFCVSRNVWVELEQSISKTLNNYTLLDLVNQYRNNAQKEDVS